MLLYASDGNEYRVNLPRRGRRRALTRSAIVYYDGAATLSIPAGIGRAGGGRVRPGGRRYRTFRNTMTLGEGDSCET